MSKEREENNRLIAEWLGWQFDSVTDTWHEPGCSRWTEGMACVLEDCCAESDLPDFCADEAANALVLEKMAVKQEHGESVRLTFGKYRSVFNGEWFHADVWQVSIRLLEPTCNADRKTAIVNAALKLIDMKG